MAATLVIIKPDAVRRRIVGQILERFERKGLCIEEMRMTTLTMEEASELYRQFVNEEFFNALVTFMCSGETVLLALSSVHDINVVQVVRTLVGPTNGIVPGSIRGDFATSYRRNVVHASDSRESAKRELALFFPGKTW